MSRRNRVREMVTCLLLVLPVSPVLLAKAPRPAKPADAKVPFPCFTQVWDGPFKVGRPSFDRAGNRVIWTLEARKDCRLAAYEAFVADGDNVAIDTVKVKFSPAGPTVKAGKQVQAVISLGSTAPADLAQVTIRERR